MKRDNFSKTVISKLERRVNGHCSNPECKVPTSGPNLGKESATCIGIAAHIAAAAPGGPRYDKNQTAEERKSIDNAIWLCVTCATRIDRDDRRYTINVLNQWKRQAEQDAFDEMGRAPISRKSYEAMKAVALGDLPRKNLISAVQEICKLSAKELEAIDPRFSVDVEYKNKKTIYKLFPQENIDCNFSISGPAAEDFLQKYSAMVDHGTALEIDMDAVTLAGSPLFDFNNGSQGKLVFEPQTKLNAVCKISITGEERNFALDDIKGGVTGGRRSITFLGSTFEDLLSLKLSVNFAEGSESSSGITFEHHYSKWSGQELLSLPYFSRIYKFFEAAVQGRLMHVSLELNGEEALSGEGSHILKKSEINQIFVLLRYIHNAREVSRFIGKNVIFQHVMKIGAEDAKELEGLYNLLFELPKLKGKEIGGMAFSLNPFDPASEDLSRLMAGDAISLHVTQEFPSPLKIFDTLVQVPKINLSYTAMRLVNSSPDDGGGIRLTLEPDVECLCQVYSAERSPHVQDS